MHNETRKQYSQFLERIAEINNVADPTQKFNVEPKAEQRLIKKIQDSHPFLKLVNYVNVDNQEGEKVMIGTQSTIAGRTDTSDGQTERKPRSVHALSGDKYRCEQTNYDTFVRYATLDAWRHKPDFQTILRQVISEQIARDHLMIAFNGVSVAANTDRATNPMLQDVNIGWLQRLRTAKPASVLTGAKIGAQSGGDYAHVDAAVFDVVHELIEPWHRDSELVVICGRKALSDKYFSLINSNDIPTERRALEGLLVNKMLGGLPTITVPFFPDNAILVTPLSNLSIYTQNGTTRLHYADNPRLDRIEEYRSVNEGFVIEDYDACCLIDKFLTYDAQAGDWK